MMENAQYDTLIEYKTALIDLLKHSLFSISSKLLARSLITREVYHWILTTLGVPDYQKAARLVSCITDRVKYTTEAFYVFLDVLNEESFFSDIVEKIRNSCACCEAGILEKQFLSMQVRLQSEIETNSEVSPEILVGSLTLLPVSLRYEYLKFLQSLNLRTLDRAEALRVIFHHLQLHFTFLNHRLLEDLINRHGNTKLKEDMSTFSEKVRIFMERTTIQQVINHEWSGRHDIPSHCAKLTAHMLIRNFKCYTLMQLNSLKQKLCSHAVSLPECCLSLVKVTGGSHDIFVHWMLPSILCSNLPSMIRLNGFPGDKDDGGRANEDDKDNDQGGTHGPSRKRRNKATNEDATKRPKQNHGKQVKISYQMLLRIIDLFEDSLLPRYKEKKLHQLQQRELMARNIQLQYY